MMPMGDLRSQILDARKPAEAPLVDESIAPGDYSPFGTLSKSSNWSQKKSDRLVVQKAHRWADSLLRDLARRQELVILAVRDAARQAEAKGLDPQKDEIYVANSIRRAWSLTSDQLSKGLKQLEKQGAIRFTHRRRGRHVRFQLVKRPHLSS